MVGQPPGRVRLHATEANPGEGRGRCKGSRAWDWRKNFSQCMLMQTKPFKLVAVALANKMARIAFAITRGKTYSAAPA
jgi:hypothetical protein